MLFPIGFLSSHMMVNPRTSDCFFMRSPVQASTSMRLERETISGSWDCEPGVVIPDSCISNFAGMNSSAYVVPSSFPATNSAVPSSRVRTCDLTVYSITLHFP